MSVIDDYLQTIEPSKRVELERIRSIALKMLPGAEETISYGMPTIKYQGKSIIGFDAHKSHIGIYPFSGSVINTIPELKRYGQTKGAVQEKLDDLIPENLITKLIKTRLDQA